MKRSTIILLCVIVAVSAALCYFWRKPSAPAPGAPPNLVTLLPPDASYILYADADALRASPFAQDLLKLFPAPAEDPEYQEFVRQTGFDYARDLDRLAVAVLPAAQGDSTLALVEGRFDRGKIAAYALRSGKQVKQNGSDAFVVSTGSPPRTISVAFLSENRLALAEDGGLEKLLKPGPASSPDSSLNQRIARVAASEVFALARVEESAKISLPENWVSKEIAEALRGVRWLTFAARPAADRMQVVLEAECETAGNARKLSWGLDGLRLFLRMALSDSKRRKMDPAVEALLQTIAREAKVSSADRYVRLSFALTSEFLATAARTTRTKAPAEIGR